jgi:hypothetical protein
VRGTAKWYANLLSPPEKPDVFAELWERTDFQYRTKVLVVQAFTSRCGTPSTCPGQGGAGCGSVVVAAATDSAARGSENRQNYANNEQDDSDDQENVGKSEGGDKGGQDEPEDDEDDAENDHGEPF